MLSTIITSYDHPDIATIHVRECMKSTVVPDEIIVVNDHGPKELKDMLKALDRNTRVVYAYVKEDIPWNYTGARNLGVWLSRGDMLSMEDCDNIPSMKAYEEGLQFMEDNPDVSYILYGKRPRITVEQAHNETQEQWTDAYQKKKITRARHNDTRMIRRDAYLKIKGCDERFAGKYAWACTDFNRRLQRAGLMEMTEDSKGRPIPVVKGVSEHFFAVLEGETTVCQCGEENRELDGSISFCLKCRLPVWRKSYANFDMAREADTWGKQNKNHTQSPIGIINFQYEYEVL